MFPHPFVFITFCLGIPQGVFLGSLLAGRLGLTGAWGLLTIIPCGILGIAIGYAEALLAWRMFRKP